MTRKKRGKKDVGKIVFIVLLVLTLFLAGLSLAKAKGMLIPTQDPPTVEGNIIHLDSMTVEQKIAQMTIAFWMPDNIGIYQNLQVGGVHIYAQPSVERFTQVIDQAQAPMQIPFFITADAEGCVTPFIHVNNFTANSEITTVGEAFEKGFRDGQFMKQMGFNLNFAPVVDLDDEIWKCRAFPGGAHNVSELAEAYTLGLQNQGLIATAKHYPGKTLVIKDPHKYIVGATIDDEDVLPYEYLAEKGTIKSMMVSHLITDGRIDTSGIPSVVNKDVIDDLKSQYDGLIISDEIHMLGLKNFYNNTREMYIGVFAAGNDIVLNFDKDPNGVYEMIKTVSQAVRAGIIPESQIDASVTKILEAKGMQVVKG